MGTSKNSFPGKTQKTPDGVRKGNVIAPVHVIPPKGQSLLAVPLSLSQRGNLTSQEGNAFLFRGTQRIPRYAGNDMGFARNDMGFAGTGTRVFGTDLAPSRFLCIDWGEKVVLHLALRLQSSANQMTNAPSRPIYLCDQLL